MKTKNNNPIYLTLLVILFLTINLLHKDAYSASILLDPGHGGKDLGTTAKLLTRSKNGKRRLITSYEKDLTLQIAKRIYKILKSRNHDVFLTRSFDRSVGLEERAEMAEKINADLFISIHVNSSWNKLSNGFETYYLSNKSDRAVKKVELVENKNLHGEELIINHILIDLIVDRVVPSSKQLAKNVHNHLKKRIIPKFKMKDRGIKAGLFYVLARSKRPSLLLEVGFASNPRELKNFALGIANGIDQFVFKAQKSNKFLF